MVKTMNIALLVAKDIDNVSDEFRCVSLSTQRAVSKYTESNSNDQFGNSVKTVNQDYARMNKLQNQIHFALGNTCTTEMVEEEEFGNLIETKIRFKLI